MRQRLTAKTNYSMNFKCQAFRMRCVFKRHVDTTRRVSSPTVSKPHMLVLVWLESGVQEPTWQHLQMVAGERYFRKANSALLRICGASSPCSWHACPASHSGDYLNNWFQNQKSHSCESHAYKQAEEPFFSGRVFGSCWWGMHVLWALKTW